jgi:hypothetical protein
VKVAVLLGVFVGVVVGLLVAVPVGVSVGVCVGVSVDVLVGVFVGVGVDIGPLSELTTSPAELPFRFQIATICPLASEDRDAATACGEFAELTVVGLDHDE